jgi:WD40 repeat protein
MKFYNLAEEFNYITAWKSPEPIKCLALSPDDTNLAIGLSNGVVRLLSLNRQMEITVSDLPLCTSPPVVALSFSADANQLAAAVRDGTVVSAYTSPRPFGSPNGPFVDESVGVVRG